MPKKKKSFKVRDVAADRAPGGSARSRRNAVTNVRPAQPKGLADVEFDDDEEGGEVMLGAGQGERGFGRRRGVQGGTRGLQGGRGRSEEGGLVEGAKDIARNVGRSTRDAAQTTMDTARSVAGRVRDNPWPSLLIGAGATWLAVDAFRGRSGESVVDYREAERGRNAMGEAVETGRSAMNTAVSKVARAGRAAGGQIEGFVRENPFLAGAATLGIGMAVGMALPASVSENQVLGGVRDKVVRRAKEAAQDTMDKVRDVTETIERVSPFGGGSSRRGASKRG